jgi:hypothetical protein
VSATINELIDQLSYCGGLEVTDVRTRARYLREAGILPPSAKGRTPQVESIHAAILLLACVAHQHQTHALAAVRALWPLVSGAQVGKYFDHEGRAVHYAHASRRAPMPFGPTVYGMIQAAAKQSENCSQTPVPWCENISVQRGAPTAAVRYKDRTDFFEGDHPPPRKGLAAFVEPCAQIRFDATIPWGALQWLGRLVSESREQAHKLGIKIDSDSAWRALGYEPTPPDGQTSLLLVPYPPSDSPPASSEPENENAAALPGATAPISDRDAPDARAERSKGNGRERQSQVPSRGHGHFPPRKESHAHQTHAAAQSIG